MIRLWGSHKKYCVLSLNYPCYIAALKPHGLSPEPVAVHTFSECAKAYSRVVGYGNDRAVVYTS